MKENPATDKTMCKYQDEREPWTTEGTITNCQKNEKKSSPLGYFYQQASEEECFFSWRNYFFQQACEGESPILDETISSSK